MLNHPVSGAGLGLRRGMFADLAQHYGVLADHVDFLEVAPENWIGVGGAYGKQFRAYAEDFPIVCHGLSLSLGGPSALNTSLLRSIRDFLDTFAVRCYSEHLSACSDHGQLYDLMPIPFTEEAVKYVADRIRTVQDILERRIAIEHVSYYAAPSQELSEIEFINSILEEADCDLLLDVNNAYVNGINFAYDPYQFLDSLPLDRITYIHIAGHYDEAPDLRVDTHASPVIEPVWELLKHIYRRRGAIPTLLERDFNIPEISVLIEEVKRIASLQSSHPVQAAVAVS